jgi:hypothetical protein
MKILMTKSWNEPEYLDDGLLHGLRTIFGSDVVEYPRMWHMYADSFGFGKKDLSSIAARGFTYYGKMEDHTVDRTDLETKIAAGYFDIIIMHSWYPSPLHDIIMSTTPAKKIVWLDGRDETKILENFIGTGIYFKRELTQNRSDVLPISFGFPEDRIQLPLNKVRAVAPLVPGNLETYIYFEETEYYKQYNQSLFGITTKKNGWDCLRHYEILGAQCIPWFLDLAFCPENTCTTLPKRKLLRINELINQFGAETFMSTMRQQYIDLSADIINDFKRHCTTAALATYVIDSVRRAIN